MFLAGFAATNPLVFSAASTVAKKAFEAVAARSLRGISDVVSEHYKGDKEVLRLRDELELKVRILALPVDICVQQAVKGNSALQGVLDVALSVLRDIEEFEESLSQQEVACGRGEGGTPSRESHSAVTKKLTTLIKQLDSLLPYLGVAISSVSLLDSGQRSYSPSRLLAASHCLRTAAVKPSSVVLGVPAATWHQEIQAATGGQARLMQNQFPLCRVAVVRAEGTPGSDSAFGYDLLVTQDLNDSLYHEEEEQPGSFAIPVDSIAHIGWATSHGMKLGDNDFTPALVLSVADGVSSGLRSENSTSSSRTPPLRRMSLSDRKPSAATPQPAQPCTRYALQLRKPPDQDSDDEEEGAEETTSDRGAVKLDPDAATTGRRTRAGELTSDWGVLGELEYVLRLCMLEVREEEDHYMIKDERLAMALAGMEAGNPAYQSAAERGASMTPHASDVDNLARNFEQVGFGSPVV